MSGYYIYRKANEIQKLIAYCCHPAGRGDAAAYMEGISPSKNIDDCFYGHASTLIATGVLQVKGAIFQQTNRLMGRFLDNLLSNKLER